MNATRIAWLGIAVVYAVVWIAFDGLAFPVQRDEVHFWPTTQLFSKSFLPSFELLKNYPDLNTPLPFIVWGWLERFFGGGILAGRHFNFVLSFLIALFVATGSPKHEKQAALSAAGLLAFPYFLGTSTHLYTDVLAAFLVLAGFVLHLDGRYIAGGMAFILAVSSRQFTVAFPVALLTYEFYQVWKGTRRPTAAFVGPLLGCMGLVGWLLFFGDFAPPTTLRAQNLDVAMLAILHPNHGLFFLAMIGLYFVVPELALLGRRPLSFGRVEMVAAGLVVLSFIAFPPLQHGASFPAFGFTDRAARAVLSDPYRVALYCGLAALSVVRFVREPLPLFLIGANAAILCKAHSSWEKYAMPALVVLWYLRSRQARVRESHTLDRR